MQFSVVTCLIVIVASVFASSDAISCYWCDGYVPGCEKRDSLVDCGDKPYCYIAMNPNKAEVHQACGTEEDCPRNEGDTVKSDDGKLDISCCHSRACNCVGLQCVSPPHIAASKLSPISSVLIIAAAAFAVQI